MSLAAALKKGLESADTFGKWDPFAEDGAAPAKGPANTNAGARAVAPRTERQPMRAPSRNLITAVREGGKSGLARLPADDAPQPARSSAQAQTHAQAQARAQAPTHAQTRPAQRPVAKQAQPASRANWLHDAVPGGRVNAAQYVRELDRFAAEESRRAVADVVMDVNPGEVEGVVRHAARIKGRYLAKLLDIGNKAKSGVLEAEIGELTRYRETYEELSRGLEILKTAIEAGDIAVSGTVRR